MASSRFSFLSRAALIVLGGGFFLVVPGCRTTLEATYHESERIDPAGLATLREAEAMAARQEWEGAESLLRELIRAHPAYFRAHRMLQDVLIASGRMEAARAEARAAVEQDLSALNLTLLARVTDTADAADALLDRALAADPTYVWAHYGRAYRILKDRRVEAYEAARHHLEEALARSSAFTEARQLLIECLHRMGETGAERDQYEVYLAFNPLDLDARYNYADLLFRRLGDVEAAMVQVKRVLEEAPDRIDALLLEAAILSRQGAYAKAESIYLYLSGEHPDALLNLALLYMDRLDEPDKAFDYFQRYLDYQGPNASEKSFWDRKILVPTYMDKLRDKGAEGGK